MVLDYVIPCLVCFILGFGVYKRVDVLGLFAEGVKEGLATVLSIFPMLLLMITTVTVLRESGAMGLLTTCVSPLFSFLGIPEGCIPLALLKPISGSGGLAIASDVITHYGSDSSEGRTAAVMLAASETSIYTIGVYFAHVKMSKTAHAIPSALLADLTAFIAAAFFVRLFFYG